jgi:hypothetical protein
VPLRFAQPPGLENPLLDRQGRPEPGIVLVMRRQGRIHAHLHAVPARGDSVHRVNYRSLFRHWQQPIQLVEEIELEV